MRFAKIMLEAKSEKQKTHGATPAHYDNDLSIRRSLAPIR
jgi:hypothetical protein